MSNAHSPTEMTAEDIRRLVEELAWCPKCGLGAWADTEPDDEGRLSGGCARCGVEFLRPPLFQRIPELRPEGLCWRRPVHGGNYGWCLGTYPLLDAEVAALIGWRCEEWLLERGYELHWEYGIVNATKESIFHLAVEYEGAELACPDAPSRLHCLVSACHAVKDAEEKQDA